MADQSAPSADVGETAHFQIKCIVPKLVTYRDPRHDFQFHFNKPRPAVVAFTQDKDYPNTTQVPAVCAATCAVEIPTAITMKLAVPSKEGSAPLGSLSAPELALIDEVLMDLRSLLKSTIDVFRWRHGLVEGPIDAVRNVEAFYSGDGKSWLKASLVRSGRFGFAIALKRLTDVTPAEIVGLVEAGKEEPIARQLFREAWELRGSNPRSALAIGIAAAEIGVKDLIAELVPNAHWLVKEIQSPSIVKMLREYLPQLPVRGHFKEKTLKLPAELITLIRKGTEYRNGLVHAGAGLPSDEELEEILRAVNDVLWICELYMGELWAA